MFLLGNWGTGKIAGIHVDNVPPKIVEESSGVGIGVCRGGSFVEG
jgi:hypothetical protein